MTICNYSPLRGYDERGINTRFKILFDEVCYLLSNPFGGGGGGGTPLVRVDFSVHADPNTSGTTFSPNTPQQTDALYVSTIDNSLWIWNGSAYVTYISPFWTISGNDSVGVNNFIGTVNNQSFKIRTNNIQRAIFDTSGNFGVNTTPTEKLDIGGNIRFSGALMPNNQAGAANQILTSQGAGAPIWSNIALSPIGSSPNANGASISGLTLNLQPASAAFGGIVTTGSQVFEGVKQYNQDIFVRNVRFGTGNDIDATNTAAGYQSLNSTLSGSIVETAFGYQTLKADLTGSNNVAIGATCMVLSQNGYNNTAVGSEAMSSSISAIECVAMGYQALKSNLGNYNIGIGSGAGYSITSGQHNIFLGRHTPTLGITSGSYNTIIGNQLNALGNISNNIIISDGQGNIRFKDDGTNTILPRLAGSGSRMVITGSNGELSTQIIPTGTTLSVLTKTGNYTITSSDDVILADATSNNITITLPTAVGIVKSFSVKRKDGTGNTLTLNTTSSQTIDGTTSISISTQYQSITVVSDNSNWYII